MTEKKPIKEWLPEDRPREKLILKGKGALSDAELLAILIGSGTKKESALDIARKLLSSINNDINELSRMELDDLIKFEGIGEAKAISIIAAIELGRRRAIAQVITKPSINNSQIAYEYFYQLMGDLKYEEFHVIYLNRKGKIIKSECISKGGVGGSFVDVKIICKRAIELLASAVIIGHNHPSGNSCPSEQDEEITKKIAEALKFFDIPLLDHIIVGEKNYYSFADNNKI